MSVQGGEREVRSFKPYPQYENSTADWIGRIPAHWTVKRIKHVARLRSGHTPSRLEPSYWVDCTIPWFGLADVWQIRDGRKEYVFETNEKISELGLANSAARLLPKGTVIVSRTASVGFSAILGIDMATTQDFVNWVCGDSIRPEYLLYVFRAMWPEFHRLTMGSTHQTIYMPDVARFTTPVPPVEEQDRIVSFIRRETAKIDALIAKKERLIELLREECGSFIAQAITRGLNPHVRMRQSDVDWLGEIPAHWRILRLKRTAILQRGFDLPADARNDGDYPVVSSAGIVARQSRWMISGPGVVIGRYGSVGSVFYVDEPFWPLNTSLYVREFYDNHQRFIFWLLKAMSVQMTEAEGSKAAVPGVNRNDLHDLHVAVPPRIEQVEIANYLDARTQSADALELTIRSGIASLNALRSAIISATVTGKIDIRDKV